MEYYEDDVEINDLKRLIEQKKGKPDPSKIEFIEFSSELGLFKCVAPKDWVCSGPSFDVKQTKEYHVEFTGPRNSEGAIMYIRVSYFYPDHGRFNSFEKYVRIQSSSPMKLDDEVYGPLTEIIVDGRKGTQFVHHTFDFFPLHAVNPKKEPILERLVIVPGLNGGIFSLEFHSPKDLSAEFMKVFDRVVDGFKPLV